MATCRVCGEEIEFRYIDGVNTPIHPFGGYFCGRSNGGTRERATSGSGGACCYRTNCPQCNDEVYFIRHNGCCVWVDPPLGWPWPKHGCFADSPNSKQLKIRWKSAHRRSELDDPPDDQDTPLNPPAVPIMVRGPEHDAATVALISQFFGQSRVKVWGIFNNRAELVAFVAYKHKAIATEYARRWSRELNNEHFIKPRDLLLRS